MRWGESLERASINDKLGYWKALTEITNNYNKWFWSVMVDQGLRSSRNEGA